MDLFTSLDSRKQSNLDKLEKIITETKQRKYLKDTEEYATNSVYHWQNTSNESLTPRSILKHKTRKYKKKSAPRVSFS